jgi:hypothetical protein
MSNKQTRQQRRAAERNRNRHNSFYQTYVRHLPQVPVGTLANPEPGQMYHVLYCHDDDCGFYVNQNTADCNCDVESRVHVEPRRS